MADIAHRQRVLDGVFGVRNAVWNLDPLGVSHVHEEANRKEYVRLERIIEQLPKVAYVRRLATDDTDHRLPVDCLFGTPLPVGRLDCLDAVVFCDLLGLLDPLRLTDPEVRTVADDREVASLPRGVASEDVDDGRL
ncbi:hypothetical protein EXE45_16860, partial [Halorubrum sp. SP9]